MQSYHQKSIFYFLICEKKISNHKTEHLKHETSEKFEKIANDLNIELLKESEGFVYDTVVSIANGKNVKIEPIDLTFKNDTIQRYNDIAMSYLLRHYLLYLS